MRKWLTLVALGVLALMLALPAVADDSKRFKGSDSGPFTVSGTSDPCVLFTQDVATGKANHGIGRYTLVASEFVNLCTVPVAVTGGQFTLTTRKGSISGTYEGTAAAQSETVITYHVEGPITGGTGRYEGVTGRIVFDGVADFVTGELSDKIKGVLFESDDDDEDD
jgi:hypothetical protein